MLILIYFFNNNMNADVYVEDLFIPYVVPYAPFIRKNFLSRQRSRLHVARKVLNLFDEIGINKLE